MEEKVVQVKVKDIAQSAQKLRLIVDAVRGEKIEKAFDILMVLNKKGSDIVRKAIKSGIANAKEIHNAEEKNIVISKISVDESRTLKRGRFASRGRSSRILKRRSHLNLELKVK